MPLLLAALSVFDKREGLRSKRARALLFVQAATICVMCFEAATDLCEMVCEMVYEMEKARMRRGLPSERPERITLAALQISASPTAASTEDSSRDQQKVEGAEKVRESSALYLESRRLLWLDRS